MSAAGRDSSLEFPSPIVVDDAVVAAGRIASPDGKIWLDGDVLACACPQCGGPVAIRAWLMMGDCLRCGTSVELTEEQEQEALRLLRRRALEQRRVEPPKPAKIAPPLVPPITARAAPAPPPPQPAPPRPAPPVARLAPDLPLVRRPPPLPVPPPTPPANAEPAKARSPQRWLADLLRDLPAWLISLIFHLVLILLLGLWTQKSESDTPSITLSAVMGRHDREGEPGIEDPVIDEVEFENPGMPPPQAELPVELKLALDPKLDIALDVPYPNLPKMSAVIAELHSTGPERMFAGRDPRVRTRVADREGGTTYTEAAVTRGLRWLSKHQSDDGHWSLHAFHETGDCRGQCGGAGGPSDNAGTAMALLPFLGAGETHMQGRYREPVNKGLQYLLRMQKPNGDLRGEGIGHMYAHGQAAIVLSEAYALTGDSALREPAQRAIDFIVRAQHSAGGWRYAPHQPGDTSVVGWQLMALRSAKMAGLKVPPRVFERSGLFLDTAKCDAYGGLYGYMPGVGFTPAMTAEALLCRQYLGWPADHPGLMAGVEAMSEQFPPTRDQANIYYWYYATQVMHHMGGEVWKRWNVAMRDVLVQMQETEGHCAGSWKPEGGGHAETGGRLYMTCLAICTLEVYYRHLPIYRTVEVKR